MTVRILVGDCIGTLRELSAESVQCCVTSPPYWGLRDYGHEGQLGLDATPEEYVGRLVEVFREVRRVLRDDGTLWLNLGDSYAGSWGAQGHTGQMADRSVVSARSMENMPHKQTRTGSPPPGLKPKDLVGIPWRVAFALQADGWWLRSDIIWAKPNPMPESVTDRPTKAHEYVFLLTKAARYFWDQEAVREPVLESGHRRNEMRTYGVIKGANCRTVWTIATQPYSGAHFAVMPPALAERCILAGCPLGGTVLDPFGGAGTTGLVAQRLQRDAILCELSPDYARMAEARIRGDAPMFADVRVAS